VTNSSSSHGAHDRGRTARCRRSRAGRGRTRISPSPRSPSGVGLHEPVLDPVVHHLHEVAGHRNAPTCGVAVLRREIEETRARPAPPRRRRRPPSGKYPFARAPTLRRRVPTVDELEPPSPSLRRTAAASRGKFRVCRRRQITSPGAPRPISAWNVSLGDLSRRHHHPEGARARPSWSRELFERPGPSSRHRGPYVLDVVSVLREPRGHVSRAHAAEADHPELHLDLLQTDGGATRRARASCNDAKVSRSLSADELPESRTACPGSEARRRCRRLPAERVPSAGRPCAAWGRSSAG